MKYTVVFHTQSGAIKFDSKMQKMKIPCLLQPVPRKLSSSCGICVRLTYAEDVKALMEPEIERNYRDVSSNEYELMYENE